MIASLRTTLVSDLETGFGVSVPVHEFWPDRFNAPCAVVTPPEGSYVTGGRNFGEYQIRMQVLLLVQHKSPNVALEALEGYIETTLANTVDWGLDGVDTPATVTINGTEYLGTVVRLNKLSTL